VPAPPSGVRPYAPIETKLDAPGPRLELVERTELISYLAGAAAKLILVGAPAGFGKTTLVAQWRASTIENRPFAWISLDGGDDDPVRLWLHVVHALRRACPGLDVDDILRALWAQDPDVTDTVLTSLVNKLAAFSAPVVLVLDDYHVIRERSIHDQLAFLLLHLPSSAVIVITTRADPPLPVARLRAAGEMVEIRMPELRFGLAEAAALVRNVSGLELSDPDLAVLLERTEGWPAGLYLAALSLSGHPSPSAFIRQFSGKNRLILDFLAEEVLSQQPDDIRQFLARTAILDRFCAPLCDAVAGSANAAKIIGRLERENLFLVPLDDNRRWYRYHHLFAQALRGQLARIEPDIVPVLHERASAWHLLYGSPDEAIDHMLASGDTAGAVYLIAQHWLSYLSSGREVTVRRWMQSLGNDRIAAHPLAAHCAAWAAAFCGDRGLARRWVQVVKAGGYEGPLPDGMRSLESSAALLGGVFGFDGIGAMRESAARAAELERDPASPWFVLARYALGFSLYLSGDLKAAARPLGQAVMSESSAPLVRLMALAVASLVATEEGRLVQARELASDARQIADEGALSNLPQYSLAQTAAGAVDVLEGQFEEARDEFSRALRSRRRRPGLSPWPTLEVLLRLASLLIDTGDRRAAAAFIEEARNILTSLPDGTTAQRARLARLERRVAARQAPVIAFADQLTEREVAVLRLLRGTLSLREIGQELHLSRNTVKTHARAIYRKLGVSTRNDAVQKSRAIGIL
jgi:LuxR family maltose regulon positive regulatory protein